MRTRPKWLPVIALIALATLTLLCGTGCFEIGDRIRGSGEMTETVHDVSGITRVVLSCSGYLDIIYGDREELSIVVDDNLQQYYRVKVKGRSLTIGTQPHVVVRPAKSPRFQLTVRELEEIQNSGSGEIETPVLRANDFELIVTGSGDLEVHGLMVEDAFVRVTGSGDMRIGELRADEVEVNISGSGGIRVVDGEVDRQEVRITGSGDYAARRVASSVAVVHLTGSGSATVHVDDQLEATITGSGDVNYDGNPKVDRVRSGSGNVRKI
jgi:hypothetical protein